MPTELLPLEFLNAGAWADVADVMGEPGWVTRLAELGVRWVAGCGCCLRATPCLLQVGESRLSLRGDCAMQILVRPVAN